MAMTMESVTESHNKAMSIFDYPQSNSAVYSSEWVEYRPVSQLTPGSALEFNIGGGSTDYIDLTQTRLHVKCRILKADGKPVEKINYVGLENLALQSLFSQVDLNLQQKPLPGVGSNYPFKAMMDVLSNYRYNYNKVMLQSQLYFKDQSGSMDGGASPDVKKDGELNVGLLHRRTFTKDGQITDLEGPLFLDLFQQERNLINGVPLNLKLWPSQDKFRLHTNEATAQAYTIDITEAFLKVCFVKVTPTVLLAQSEILNDTPALYPYIRSDIKTFTISKGEFALTVDDVFQGDVPTTLKVALVSSEAFNGSYKKNPYNFDHYNCNYAGFSVDGHPLPARPFQPNFKDKLYVEPYFCLFNKQNKVDDEPFSDYISRNDYPHGYCIYVFDLAASNDCSQLPVLRKGLTRLELKFSEALPESVTAVVYGSFPDIIKIDKARNII